MLILSIGVSIVLLVLLIMSWRKQAISAALSAEPAGLSDTVHDALALTIGHDLRSASNVLNAFNKLLDYGDIPASAMETYTEDLKIAIRNNSFLVENVFNWVTSQLPEFKPETEDFDISLRANEVILSLALRAKAKKITIRNVIPEGSVITADLNMTEMVLKNLIHNAIKFTHPGGTIELSAAAEGNKLRLVVKDPGTGMPDVISEQLNTGIYLQFFKSLPGTEEEQGTGVGLILSKHFLRLMNAGISAQSEPGKGTAVAVLFVRPVR